MHARSRTTRISLPPESPWSARPPRRDRKVPSSSSCSRGVRRLALLLAMLPAAVGAAGCARSDERLERLRNAAPLVGYVPPGGRLTDETTLRSSNPIFGQAEAPTVLRRFRPVGATTLQELVAAFDREAERLGRTVEIRRGGHCTTTSVGEDTAVLVWLLDQPGDEVRFRAVWTQGQRERSSACTTSAGPPAP